MAGVPDVTTIAANAVVFAAAIGAAAAGSLAAVRVIKKQWLELFEPDEKGNNSISVTGGVIMENMTMIQLTEALRDLKEEAREWRYEIAIERARRNQS